MVSAHFSHIFSCCASFSLPLTLFAKFYTLILFDDSANSFPLILGIGKLVVFDRFSLRFSPPRVALFSFAVWLSKIVVA